ncbi:hypothetical protein CsSME_00052298 [Camellia sinensis var. sinensis]
MGKKKSKGLRCSKIFFYPSQQIEFGQHIQGKSMIPNFEKCVDSYSICSKQPVCVFYFFTLSLVGLDLVEVPNSTVVKNPFRNANEVPLSNNLTILMVDL